MSEHALIQAERRQLLLADGRHSLAALQHSLQGHSPAGAEAALHLMDLASMLSGLGFKNEAHAIRELGRGLAEDPAASARELEGLVPAIETLIQALQDDDAPGLEQARQTLREGFGTVAAPLPWAAADASEPLDAHMPPMAEAPVAPPRPEPARQRAVEPTPLFSAGLATGAYAQAPAALPSVPAQPQLLRLREQLLEGVQESASWIHEQAGVSPAVLLKLAATQDGLVRVGQLPLQQVYPEAHGASACWADPPVLELLEHLTIFSQRASRIAVQLRNLTLFVHWRNVSLSQGELLHIGDRLAGANGRVQADDGGIQLVLPCSAQRMRMVSYRMGGQWHAACWAQFMGWDPEAPQARLRLQCGTQSVTRPVDETGGVSNMNLYPWPDLVPAPAGLWAVALDAGGRLHQVRRHGP